MDEVGQIGLLPFVVDLGSVGLEVERYGQTQVLFAFHGEVLIFKEVGRGVADVFEDSAVLSGFVGDREDDLAPAIVDLAVEGAILILGSEVGEGELASAKSR